MIFGDDIGTTKVPPSFNPGTILEDTLREIKARQKLEWAFPILTEPAKKPRE